MRFGSLIVLAPLLAALTWLGCNQILGNETYQTAGSFSSGPGGASSASGSSGSSTSSSASASSAASSSGATLPTECGPMVANASNQSCGALDHSCLGDTCADGLCPPQKITTVVVPDGGILNPAAAPFGWSLAVASDDSALVWTDPEQGVAQGCELKDPTTNYPSCPSIVTLESAPAGKHPNGALYAAGPQRFYWVTNGGEISYTSTTSLTPVLQVPTAIAVPSVIGVDPSGEVYWAKGNTIVDCKTTVGCSSVDTAVSPPDAGPLRNAQISVDGARLAWDDFVESHACKLGQASDGGCAPATSFPGIGAMGVADGGSASMHRAGTSFLYYVIGPELYRTPYDAPDAAVDAGPAHQPADVAPGTTVVSPDAVYYASNNGAAIFRVKESCPSLQSTLTLATSSQTIRAIAVSTKYVYWLDAKRVLNRVGR